MDCTLVTLLSRESIERELKERRLSIPYLESLSHSDMLRIYRTFAVPLMKRQRNNKSTPSATNDKSGIIAPPRDLTSTQEIANAMDVEMLEAYAQSIKTTNGIKCYKRAHIPESEDSFHRIADDMLIKATKCIKISWP